MQADETLATFFQRNTVTMWECGSSGLLLSTLQVNATGVMPVIFSSSLLAAPAALSRYFPQVIFGPIKANETPRQSLTTSFIAVAEVFTGRECPLPWPRRSHLSPDVEWGTPVMVMLV